MRTARTPRGAALVGLTIFAIVGCYGGSDEKTRTETGTKVTTKPANANPVVELATNKGLIVLELYPDKAPKAVENFLRYANEGFYAGTIFHRVIPDFMIQGGGYTKERERKATRESIPNEASNGLKNEVGMLSMARTSDPNSATSQFYINVKDNSFLDFKSESPQGWGYTVFGKVIQGMEVVHAIATTPTSDGGGAFANLPQEPVVIESATVKKSS